MINIITLAIIDIIAQQAIHLKGRRATPSVVLKKAHQRRGTRFNRIRIVANTTHILKKRINHTIQLAKFDEKHKEETTPTAENQKQGEHHERKRRNEKRLPTRG
jgi:hypothetical protein